MKKTVTLFLLALVLVMGIGCTAGAEADLSQFAWRSYTLSVAEVSANPDHVLNESPDQDQFVMVRLACVSGEVSIGELVENLYEFSLVDAEGNSYDTAAYMPYKMGYNRRNGVFTTAGMQSKFDLFFIVPAGTALENLALETETATVMFMDLDPECLSQ